MPWYIYAILAPTLFSVVNYIEKFLIDKQIKHPSSILVISGFLSFIISVVAFILSGFKIVDFQQILLLIGIGILLKLYLLPYYQAIKIEDASTVIPLFQLSPVIVLVLGKVFLNENLFTQQVIGAVIVILGSMLIINERLELKVFKPRKAFYLMLFPVVSWAVILVLIRYLTADVSVFSIVAYQYLGSGLFGLALLLFSKVRKNYQEDAKVLKKTTGFLVVDEALVLIGNWAGITALSIGPGVGLVSLIGSTQPLFMLVFGVILSIFLPKIIKEDLSKSSLITKGVGILIIFLGMALVYLV